MRLIVIVLLLTTLVLHAQTPAGNPLPEANRLRDANQPRAAITLLQPLVQNPPAAWSEADRGTAWTMLGASFQDLESYDQARRCYESAIQILGKLPASKAGYAAALDRLGSVEGSTGNVDAALKLRRQANRLYAELGDGEGLVISFNNLALNALAAGNARAARKFLNEAFNQSAKTTLRNEDRAALFSIKGSLEFHQGDLKQALAAYQQSIALMTRPDTPPSASLGVVFALRAQAYLKVQDLPHADADIAQAERLIGDANGTSSPAYLRVETLRAQALRLSGDTAEAARLEQNSSGALISWQHGLCAGCIVNVHSLR